MTESNCQDGKLKTPKRHESHQFINHINQPFVKAKSFKDFLVSHPPGVMIPVMIQFEFDEDLCKCWFNHPTSCALMFYSFFFGICWVADDGWRFLMDWTSTRSHQDSNGQGTRTTHQEGRVPRSRPHDKIGQFPWEKKGTLR